jgi:hypothetical protein
MYLIRFLQASLMVEVVSHCTSSVSVMEKLDKLPPKLDVLYDETLKRIDMQAEEHAALAKRVLPWVAYAYRPLTSEDMQYAVASDGGRKWPKAQRYPGVGDSWVKEPETRPAEVSREVHTFEPPAPQILIPESLMISVCCGLVVFEKSGGHSRRSTFRLVRQFLFHSY